MASSARTNRMRQPDPEPPYRPDLVRSLLGAVFADRDIYPQVAPMLKGDDFYPSDRAVWEAFAALAERGDTPDEFSVIEYLERHGQLELAGGALEVQQLNTFVSPNYVYMAVQWAQAILDDSKRRTLIALSQAQALHAYYPDIAAHRADMERLQRRLDDIQRRMRGDTDTTGEGALLGVSMADVKVRDFRWLWHGRIAFGKLNEYLGDGGTGKSLATLDLAARVRMGLDMPDGSPGLGEPAGVVIICGEDALDDTVAPRLLAAGVSPEAMDRIRAINGAPERLADGTVVERMLSLLADLPALEATITAIGARLLIIDPVTAYLGDGVDAHRDNEVRRALTPVAQMAERLDVAVVFIRHTNRAQSQSVQHRGLGSVAFTNITRLCMLFAPSPDTEGEVLFGRYKENIGKPVPTLKYRIVQVDEAENMPRICWLGESETTARDAMAAQPGATDGESRTANEDATEWLRALLTDGPRPADDVFKEAIEAHIISDNKHDYPLRAAKKRLGITIKNGTLYREGGIAGGGRWMWQLYVANTPSDSHLSENGPPEERVAPDFNGAPTKMRSTSDSHLSTDAEIIDADAVPEGDNSPKMRHLRVIEHHSGAIASDALPEDICSETGGPHEYNTIARDQHYVPVCTQCREPMPEHLRPFYAGLWGE